MPIAVHTAGTAPPLGNTTSRSPCNAMFSLSPSPVTRSCRGAEFTTRRRHRVAQDAATPPQIRIAEEDIRPSVPTTPPGRMGALTRPGGDPPCAREHGADGLFDWMSPDFVLPSYAKELFRHASLRRYGAGKLTVRATRSSARGDTHLTIRVMLCAPFRAGTAHIV